MTFSQSQVYFNTCWSSRICCKAGRGLNVTMTCWRWSAAQAFTLQSSAQVCKDFTPAVSSCWQQKQTSGAGIWHIFRLASSEHIYCSYGRGHILCMLCTSPTGLKQCACCLWLADFFFPSPALQSRIVLAVLECLRTSISFGFADFIWSVVICL